MDKHTLGQYGWAVIVVIIIAILLGCSTPFGNFIGGFVTDFVQKIDPFPDSQSNPEETTNPGGGVSPGEETTNPGDETPGGGTGEHIDVPEATDAIMAAYMFMPYIRNDVLQSKFTQPIPTDGNIPATITYADDTTEDIVLVRDGDSNDYEWKTPDENILFSPNQEFTNDVGGDGDGSTIYHHADSTMYHQIEFDIYVEGTLKNLKSINILGCEFTPIKQTKLMIPGGIEYHGTTDDIKRIIVDFTDGTQSVAVDSQDCDRAAESKSPTMGLAICYIDEECIEDGLLGFDINGEKIAKSITIEEEVNGVAYTTTYNLNVYTFEEAERMMGEEG